MTESLYLLHSHQFALVDRTNLRPQDWHASLPLLPLAPKKLKADTDKLPALLPLSPDAPYLDALAKNMELAKEDPEMGTLCALLRVSGEIAPEQLQRHLANLLGCPWESFEEYSKATEVAERAALAAQELYGIEDKGDLLAYVVDALIHGEHFHRHPHIQNLLRNPLPEGYGMASAEFDKTFWAEVQTYALNSH